MGTRSLGPWAGEELGRCRFHFGGSGGWERARTSRVAMKPEFANKLQGEKQICESKI